MALFNSHWSLTRCDVFYLEAAYNLPEWQSTLIATDEGGGGESEHFVQVGLSQPIKTCCEHKTWGEGTKQTPGQMGKEGKTATYYQER